MLEIDDRLDHQRDQRERPYQGAERRFAFFPRRLQRDARDPARFALDGGERRSGNDRRLHDSDDAG